MKRDGLENKFTFGSHENATLKAIAFETVSSGYRCQMLSTFVEIIPCVIPTNTYLDLKISHSYPLSCLVYFGHCNDDTQCVVQEQKSHGHNNLMRLFKDDQ